GRGFESRRPLGGDAGAQASHVQLGGVAERRGSGLQSRLHGFESRLHLPVSLGRLAQLARALPRHGRSHRFESCIAHKQHRRSESYLTVAVKMIIPLWEIFGRSSSKRVPSGARFRLFHGSALRGSAPYRTTGPVPSGGESPHFVASVPATP